MWLLYQIRAKVCALVVEVTHNHLTRFYGVYLYAAPSRGFQWCLQNHNVSSDHIKEMLKGTLESDEFIMNYSLNQLYLLNFLEL